MLEKYIPKRFATAMIKHVIAVTLFFPYFYSNRQVPNPYYQDFVLANVFAILAIIFVCTSWKLDFKRNAVPLSVLGGLLVAYNIFATYMNVKYHHWYGEQINTSIAFLFFIVLFLVKDKHALIDTSTIKATIHMIVASNVLAICCCNVFVYTKIIISNDTIETIQKMWWQNFFSWLYGHKCEYGLILVICIALFAIYRKSFRNTLTYALSQCILLYALYLSGVYTSMVAALFIFVGQFLDYILTAKWWKKLLTIIVIPPCLLWTAIKLLAKIESDRNILTLGYRIPIWKQFISYIHDYPQGILLNNFGEAYLKIKDLDFSTNNAHNIFLNHMIRFSIPVGIIFILLFSAIFILSLKSKPCFTTIFIWVAILIPINMDYSLLSHEFSFFLLVIFLIFLNQKRSNSSSI